MICDNCKEEFKPHHGHQKRFCSGWCRRKWHTTEWRSKNPNNVYHWKRRYYLKKYGISVLDYNRLFEEQKGRCKICKKHQADLPCSLHVDHNHETNEIRGLLCQKCNNAIGLLEDNPEIIASALEYVS